MKSQTIKRKFGGSGGIEKAIYRVEDDKRMALVFFSGAGRIYDVEAIILTRNGAETVTEFRDGWRTHHAEEKDARYIMDKAGIIKKDKPQE